VLNRQTSDLAANLSCTDDPDGCHAAQVTTRPRLGKATQTRSDYARSLCNFCDGGRAEARGQSERETSVVAR
jgi:hypothetical protein